MNGLDQLKRILVVVIIVLTPNYNQFTFLIVPIVTYYFLDLLLLIKDNNLKEHYFRTLVQFILILVSYMLPILLYFMSLAIIGRNILLPYYNCSIHFLNNLNYDELLIKQFTRSYYFALIMLCNPMIIQFNENYSLYGIILGDQKITLINTLYILFSVIFSILGLLNYRKTVWLVRGKLKSSS